MGKSDCDKCVGLCCRYFALPIEAPRTVREFDDIRWYLMHENVMVYVEKRQWYVGILNKCKNLRADFRCGIYDRRPAVCREYSSRTCDFQAGEYDFDLLFTSAEQLEQYAEKKLKKKAKTPVKKVSRAGRKMLELPVV